MAEGRPAIPRELARAVLVEAGHRCAIPTCRQPTTQLHHIEPWARVKEHTFDNLIALCPNDHARAKEGDIDKRAMLAYKRNLAILTSRYGDAERRLLDLLARNPTATVELPNDMGFELYYLLQDGLLTEMVPHSGIFVGSARLGPHYYALTPEGREFLDQWLRGAQVG